jgi:hypothetical protein
MLKMPEQTAKFLSNHQAPQSDAKTPLAGLPGTKNFFGCVSRRALSRCRGSFIGVVKLVLAGW